MGRLLVFNSNADGPSIQSTVGYTSGSHGDLEWCSRDKRRRQQLRPLQRLRRKDLRKECEECFHKDYPSSHPIHRGVRGNAHTVDHPLHSLHGRIQGVRREPSHRVLVQRDHSSPEVRSQPQLHHPRTSWKDRPTRCHVRNDRCSLGCHIGYS